MPQILESLAVELERKRPLPAQVVHHLIGMYGLARDAIGTFLVDELTRLDDPETDLALSPVFTPTLQDQAIFADLLGQESIARSRWPGLIRDLVSRPTRAQLVTEDGKQHAVTLREVSIERYVHRLRLDATIAGPLFHLLDQFSPARDRPLLKAVARRAVWENATRQEILTCYLNAAVSHNAYRRDDVIQLLKLVEIYQPTDVAHLLEQVPHWLDVLRQELNESAGGKPFFNERVEELHGGGRDQRRHDHARMAAKENEQAFLERLQPLLKH